MAAVVLEIGAFRIIKQTVHPGTNREQDVTVKLCEYCPPVRKPDGTEQWYKLKRIDPETGERVPDPAWQVVVENGLHGGHYNIRKNHAGYRVRYPGVESKPVQTAGTGKKTVRFIAWWDETTALKSGGTYPEENHPPMGEQTALRYLTQQFGQAIADRIVCEIMDADCGNPLADAA